MGYGGGGGAAELARQQEMEKKNRIAQGRQDIDEQFAGFNDEFYDQRKTDYENYALPQVEQQARGTRNQLAASLARRGLLKSGAAIKANADLDQYTTTQRNAVADTAINESNKLKQGVEDQRSTLVNQLVASGDPSTASAGALAAASTLKRPSGYAALGNLFSDFVDTWKANQVAKSYDGSVPSLFSFGGKNKSSVSYVN